MAKQKKSLKSLVEFLQEAGYAGQGHTSGAESFYGTYFGFGGDLQLAKKPVKAVRDLKAQEDDEAYENSQDQQQRNRGYPAAVGYAGGDGRGGPGSGARIPNTLNQIGKTAQELDVMFFTDDPSKDYWGEPEDDDRDLEEQLSGAGQSSGWGNQRSVASDGNHRDLPGFPRHNALEYEQDHIPPVEGDVDGDGEEDVYLTDEEYVNDVMRLNGLAFAPGDFKRLFGVSTLDESALSSMPSELYHGTSTAALEQIKASGFLKTPVYLGTDEIAEYYAEVAAEEDGSEEVILTIRLADLDLPTLEPDDNSIAEPLTYTLGKSEEEVWEEWEEAEGTWEDSLDIVGSVKYLKPIPLKNVILESKLDEQGAYTSPGYGPEPNKGIERYKQGKKIMDHEPDATKKLIHHVDYTQGHADMAAAEFSPGAQAYGQIGTPKDFVPEDWEQRNWKTEEEEVPMDMSQLEEMIQVAVREALDERRVISSKKLVRKLKKNKAPGCDHVRQKGSHATFRCDICQTVVPVHGSKDIKPGTLKSIERDLEPCLGDDWLDEAIQKLVAQELGEAFTGIHDETGKGEPEGGSEAFRKNREDVLDYDEKQKPQGKEDLKNYHLGDND